MGTWALKKRRLAGRAARRPRDRSVLPSGTGAGDERLVGRDKKQQRNKTRGEARRLSLTSTTAARKASRQLAERGPDTTASVPRGNDGYGFPYGDRLNHTRRGSVHSDVCNYECLKQSHARTVVRECCKGDDESQWERVKFDPPPPKNPLTDGHQNLRT